MACKLNNASPTSMNCNDIPNRSRIFLIDLLNKAQQLYRQYFMILSPKIQKAIDVVLGNNCSIKVLDEEQRENFKNYLENGGGYLSDHASGDNSHRWECYETEVLGTLFSHHPLNPQFQTATMYLEEGNTLLTDGLQKTWMPEEEWYVFFESSRKKGFDILYTVDETNMNPSGHIPLLGANMDSGMGEAHPIVCYHPIANRPCGLFCSRSCRECLSGTQSPKNA